MTQLRRIGNTVVGLVLIVSVLWYAYSFGTAEARVKELCAKIREGDSVEDLRKFAAANGLGPTPSEKGVAYIVERRTFGRYGCKVVLGDGHVKSSEFNFAD